MMLLTDALLAAFPFALFHGRAAADAIVVVLDLLFLLHCVRGGDWAWTRPAWVRLAGALWLWLVVCTVLGGSLPAVLQALAVLRLLLFVPALSTWALRAPRSRRWLLAGLAAAAAWLVSQVWLQYLTGSNLAGAPRFGDGALTGPFAKPRAGGVWLALLFPVVVPAVLALLARRTSAARAGGIGLLVAALATMVLIGQRMPTLLAVLGLGIAALTVRALRLPTALAVAGGAVLLALTPLLSPPTYAKLVLRFADQVGHFWSTDYGALARRAAAMVAARPLTGWGFDGFRNHCGDPAFAAGQPPGGCNLHPHNYYLDVAVSAGLPGVLMFAALAVLWLRALPQPRRPRAVGLFVAVAVALWPIASTSSLFVAETAGWVFLSIGWALAEAADVPAITPGAARSPGSSARADRAPA